MIDHKLTQVIAHPVGIPHRPPQQVLHPIRRRLTSMLSNRPAILARQVSQQSQDKCPNPSPRFDPAEPTRHPSQKGSTPLSVVAGL
jgi:hypothetical protein